jgi:hypothetical protein
MQLNKQTAEKNIAWPNSYYDFYRTTAHIRLYSFSRSITIHYIRTVKYCWGFSVAGFCDSPVFPLLMLRGI